MNWDELFQVQKQLDHYIEQNHDLTAQDLFQEKHLALLVELGELANETRCFKFWSNKPRNEKAVILEEYVDGLHFILSLGLLKGYRYDGGNIEKATISETEQFNQVFDACFRFKNNPGEETYKKLFEEHLRLGELLGFGEAEIQEAYFKKNDTNYNRQKQGY